MNDVLHESLQSAVADAVGGRVTELADVKRTDLDYDAFLAHRTVSRLQGTAIVDGKRIQWSMIEKRTEGPLLASPYLLDNGRREFDAYASGVLDDVALGIGTPRLHGKLLDPDGGMTLWLEEIRHEGSRPLDAETILAAARNLGGMGGRWAGRELSEPWHFTGWIDRHSQPEAVEQGLATLRRGDPGAVSRLGDRMAAAEQLVFRQSRYREILKTLPHTLCHHDAVGANVFSSAGRTVLIDWESVGAGPVGADLASLLFASVRRGDALAGVVMPIVDDALVTYAEALRAEAGNITFEEVRLGFDAAIALRWKLAADVVAGIERGQPPRRGSLPDEDPAAALDELIALVDLLLASADRALRHAP
ncbi:phosphotransferase family protein [uncultured Arthrobacter sp.]|uniref:phosphotransferase family protein n=1 Tax=uncultured Arthrobacter sp. TaxID=114050 RepID=UPI00261619EA|nr:phosphotransferase [uncultured Arthrobacter sp.]